MEARFPGLIVAGTRNGFFADDEIAGVVDEIRASGAKLLFVGLGLAASRVVAGRTPARDRCAERRSASAVRSTCWAAA